MRTTWKYTAVLTLLIIGVMQVLPFVPTHSNCQAACCVEAVSCCESEENSSCDMAMTSCNVSLFIPLVSAPLIKVESNVQLDIIPISVVSNEVAESQQDVDYNELTILTDSSPPGYFPLLI